MKTKILVGAFFLVTLIIVSTANAGTSGAYVGFTLGNSTPEDTHFDSAMGWKVLAGYALNANWAVEGGYTSFGEMDGPLIMGYSTSVESAGVELAAVGSYSINDKYSLLGKLGVLNWNFDINIDGIGTTSTSGMDIFFGLGGKYNINDKLSVCAIGERYTDEDDGIYLLSVSLIYSFK